MNFTRQTLQWDASFSYPAALCARLAPACWSIEPGIQPPPYHHPSLLPLGDGLIGGLALSLCSATAIGLSPGPALVDRLTELGASPGPLAGLALHELIANAVIHGNLQVGSGRSELWRDLSDRQHAIAAALADPSRAARVVTIAIGWRSSEMVAVIADEGGGYDPIAVPAATRGSGRGLRLAGTAGRVIVSCGGRTTAIIMQCPAAPERGGP
jgi:hypothetical protein